MLNFGSFYFAVFFTLVVLISFSLKPKWAKIFLLGSSLYFYSTYNIEYLALLIFIVVLTWGIALKMHSYLNKNSRIALYLLYIGILTPLSGLFFFKYVYFFATQVSLVWQNFIHKNELDLLKLALPAGISFFTFQSIAYLVDVYKQKGLPEKNLFNFALYICWFPHIISGPIARAFDSSKNKDNPGLLAQIKQERKWNSERTSSGLRYVLQGLFKKAVIADSLGAWVAPVFVHPEYYQGPILVAAALVFSIQIYCDFSGYSDMAYGLSKILGWEITQNFKRPYFAHSMSDFWRRWHISLSTWFRDYVYIPLGGNQKGTVVQNLNLMTTFTLSGLWHGANWTYVIWGAWNGLLLIVEKWIPWALFKQPLLLKFLQHLFTLVGIYLGWVFFRASSFDFATHILVQMPWGWENIGSQITRWTSHAAQEMSRFYLLIIFVTLLFIKEFLEEQNKLNLKLWPKSLRWALYWVLAFIILFYGQFGQTEFIYQQF